MSRRWPKEHKRLCPSEHTMVRVKRVVVQRKGVERVDVFEGFWCKRCGCHYVVKNGGKVFSGISHKGGKDEGVLEVELDTLDDEWGPVLDALARGDDE